MRRGHPWVYDSEVEGIGGMTDIPAGSIVNVLDHQGAPLGVGLWNRQSSIPVRMLTGCPPASACLTDQTITDDLLRQRIRQALQLRERRYREPFYRLVNGEADKLPGLFIDRLGKALLVRFDTIAMPKYEGIIYDELEALLRPKVMAVHKLNSKKEKRAQGGNEYLEFLAKGDDHNVKIREGDCAFFMNLLAGATRSWDYQARETRQFVSDLCGGGELTVLDMYSNNGAMGIQAAAKGAAEVVFLEDSLTATALIEQNIKLNDVQHRCTALHRSNIDEELKSMLISNLKFGCVVVHLRPVIEYRFTQRHGPFGKWFKPTLKGIERILRLAVRLTARGGYLCAPIYLPFEHTHWTWNVIRTSLSSVERSGAVVWEGGASYDHGMMAVHTDYWQNRTFVVRVD